MKLRPIAFVRNGIEDDVDDWSQVESRLVFEEEFVPGLFKIGQHARIWVIFGFDRKRGWSPRVHPMHDPGRPMVGVFASRSPKRPNRLGLTMVELVRVRGRIMTVRGLDAYDGSPVFDIKPVERDIVNLCQRARKK